ncbi:MAG: cytochrome c biogenesis protein ResB [Nitrospirae bacterium]|nr:cytochrome c biogenesis protein ResB [Nitrospirota bacterium]
MKDKKESEDIKPENASPQSSSASEAVSEDKKKTTIIDAIWNFLASVKLAIWTIAAIALTSIIGTIIQQDTEPANNIKFLAKLFGDGAAPTVYNIFLKLGFMNMYQSWWFVSLLILLCINLTVCSIDRFPKTWKLVKLPLRPMQDNALRALPIKKEMTVKSSLSVVKDEISNSMSSLRYKAFTSSGDNHLQLYSEKGRYTRLGFYVVHVSLLLIFIGAIVGARFGFRGFLNLPEGAFSDVAFIGEGKKIPLDFIVKCNWYNTEYYVESDTPQKFQSELVIIDGGREVMKKVIEVNSPLTYKGITFYQSSYGMLPNSAGEFVLKVAGRGSEGKISRLRFGDTFEIPGTNTKGTIIDFSPALGRDPQTGKLFTYADTMINPAVAVQFNENGKDTLKGWILKRYPQTGNMPDGSKIEFLDYWGVEYTGLQVSRDPGVGLIYLASIIMAAGLYMTFFMSHKKVWVKISEEKGAVRIIAGGSASKNKLSLERDLDKILAKASHSIEGRSKK